MHWAAMTTPRKQIQIQFLNGNRVIILIIQYLYLKENSSSFYEELDILHALHNEDKLEDMHFWTHRLVKLNCLENWINIELLAILLKLFNYEYKFSRYLEPKRSENVRNGELNGLYRLANIVRENKSLRLKCTGHLATMKEGENFFQNFNR